MQRERDNSEIATFLMCPRAHDYAYHQLLRPIRDRLILTAGTAAHAAAALLMQDLEWRPHINNWEAAMLAALGTGADGPEPSYSTEDVTEKANALRHGLRAYEEWWAGQDCEVISIEEYFRWSVPGTRTVLVGRADAVVRIAGQVWLQELKTSSRRWSAREVAINRQFASYTAAWRETYPELVGVRLVNIYLKVPTTTICKPTKKWPKGYPSTAETVNCPRETYLSALQQCEIAEGEEKFAAVLGRLPGRVEYHIQEDPSAYSVDAIAHFVEEDLRDVIRLMDRAKREHFRVRSPGLFAMNCQSCAYHSLCSAELHGHDTSDLAALGYTVGTDKYPYLRDDVEEE